jgi:hypothetical protein
MTYICTLKVKSKKMDNQIKRGEKRWGNQEWVIQRHWHHLVHGAKTRRKAMGQSRMGNPETLATFGTIFFTFYF